METPSFDAGRQVLEPADNCLDQQLICLLDHNGRVIRANETLQRWSHSKFSHNRGHDLHEALHADCSSENCYLRHFCERGSAEIAAGRHLQCDVFDPVLNRFFSIRGEPARLGREETGATFEQSEFLAMLVLEDVTDARLADERITSLNRKLSRQILLEMQKRKEEEAIRQRMQALIESTANCIAMCDAQGKLTYLNPAGRAMLGIDPLLDVSAMTILELHAEAAAKLLWEQSLPMARENGKWIGPSMLRSRTGEEIETSQVIIAHHGPDGRLDGYSVVDHNMTEWLQREQELRDSHAELTRLSERLINVQEEERQRIAVDLHDGLGQSLSLIKMRVSVAAALLEQGGRTEALAILKGLLPQVHDTIDEVRRVATDLHPQSLTDLGILATLAWFVREVEAACNGIRVDLELMVREVDIHPSLRIVIFRIIQEAVGNILKHALPQRIKVALRHDGDSLQLSVEDDGCGFDPDSVVGIDHAGRGFGLSSMKERARLSGGSYELRSALGQGTRILVEWPMLAST